MHYPLIHRFQGALLGAAIGEILGANCQQAPQPWREVEHWGLHLPKPSPWGKLAVIQAQWLIQGKGTMPLPQVPEPSPAQRFPSGRLEQNLPIALLPIALFYHEDLALLQAHFAAALCYYSPQILDRCLEVGEAIALILQEKAPPQSSDFRLTLLHSAKTCPDHCAIAGAIAGATHRLAGIPPSWRHRLNRAGYASFWGLTTEAELLQTAGDLLAAWSGIYHPTQRLLDPVVAMPRVMRRF
jgi:hypothetical protein